MRSKKVHGRTWLRPVPVRVTPLAAAVATAMGSFAGISTAAADTEELVVTATRRDASVQEVPGSVAALSGEDIRDLQINDLSDIARWSAGLIQVDQGARDANLMISRGINANAINSPELLNNSTGDRVATYYGETPVYVNLQPIDIGRIEVLRGPQGTLFGARSLGGAIRYIPNKPDTEAFSLDAHVRAFNTAESADRSREGDVVVNVPLITDTLALRGLLGYSHVGGYIDYDFVVPNPGVSCPEPGYSDPECSSDGFNQFADANDIDTRSYGLSLLWTPFDDLEAVLSWRQQNRDIGGRNINSRDALELIEVNRGIALDVDGYTSGMRFLEPQQRVNNITNLNIIWNTAIGELTSSTSYTTYDEDGQRDQTDLLLDLEPDSYYYYEEFPAFSAFTAEVKDDEIFTQEVRLVSTGDGPLNWLAGVFYQESDLFARSTEFTPGYAEWDPFFTTDNGDVEYDNKTFQKDKEIAVYGEIGYDISDQLSIAASARWFDFETRFRTCTAFPIATTGFGGSPDVDDPSNCEPGTGFRSVSDDDITSRLQATYRFTDDMNVYALYSEGYSSGGVNVRVDTEDQRLIKPERTKNYELGIKSLWLDQRLTANAAVYYIDWDDIQILGLTDQGFSLIRNLGEAESTGLELDLQLQLTDALALAAGYAYTNAELSQGCSDFNLTPAEIAQLCGDALADSAKGDRLPGSPEHSGYVRAAYVTSVGPGMDFRATYGIRSQSDVLTKLGVGGSGCCRDNGERLGGFSLHNVSAGLETETWQATLFVENLLNKYAVTGVRLDQSFLRTAGAAPDFTLRRYFQNVIRPRNVGIDFRYRFR